MLDLRKCLADTFRLQSPAHVAFHTLTKFFVCGTARSVEDETRNGDRNANRNPKRNHETIVLGLFSLENLKRAIKQ